MATVTHHIRSTDDTDDVEQLQRKPILNDEGEDVVDPWLTERPFGISERVAKPPVFVPAKLGLDDWTLHLPRAETSKSGSLASSDLENSVATWYRSLERKTLDIGAKRNIRRSSSKSPSPKPATGERPKAKLSRSQSDWFISRVLESSKTTGDGVPLSSASSPGTSTPTLADILERDPPPLPSEPSYIPPVWLTLGPGNKGFQMLQRSGWEEGEALGKVARSRTGLGFRGKIKSDSWEAGATDTSGLQQEIIDLTRVDDELVDLTIEDGQDPDSLVDLSVDRAAPLCRSAPPELSEVSGDLAYLDHGPRSLVTPLPTVLKSDRLGIGLKAKTVGSGLSRLPVKRVTHSQAALERHTRANEELRRLRRTVGRGRRGFDRMKKKDEESRRKTLAYLNAD